MAASDAGSAMSLAKAWRRTASAGPMAVMVAAGVVVGAGGAPAAGVVVVVVGMADARVEARPRISPSLSSRILDVSHTVPCSDAPAVISDWRRESTGLRSTPL